MNNSIFQFRNGVLNKEHPEATHQVKYKGGEVFGTPQRRQIIGRFSYIRQSPLPDRALHVSGPHFRCSVALGTCRPESAIRFASRPDRPMGPQLFWHSPLQ